ncbi:hypothetical protein JS86_19705 [Vibrio vulnificus]|nr:hypothetical protein JS86_19705 [Vibrio vulnificus]
MPKCNESQIKLRIERVLQRYPTSTSQDVRQRLMLTVKPSYLYSYFFPFYESGRIDDRADIQRAIRAMMKEHLGFSVIAQKLASGRYNFLQVEQALRLLQAEFDHVAQTKRCKVARFGSERPIDEHHQSQVVMYLQKKGHRLTDIWSVLIDERFEF